MDLKKRDAKYQSKTNPEINLVGHQIYRIIVEFLDMTPSIVIKLTSPSVKNFLQAFFDKTQRDSENLILYSKTN